MTAWILIFLRIALMVALYAFLGWAFWFLLADLKSQATRTAKGQIPSLHLTWKIQELAQTAKFSKSIVLIGRDPTCDVRLDESTVSIIHSRLTYHHQQWWLEDTGSTNGTTLNEQPIAAPIVITNGDQVGCGNIVLSVTVEI
jgi:pSer/pThr/pTyr-binding forkhead associated (FHA) protein